MKTWKGPFILVLALVLAFALATGCGEDEDAADTLDEERKVEEININTTTMDYDEARYEAALWIGDIMEEELGVDVNVNPLEFATLTDAARADPGEPDWDASTLGWSGRVERTDPDMFTHTLFHSEAAYGGGNNYANYQNEDYDELAEAARAAMDEDERHELVYEIQEKLAEDVPMNVLYSVESHQGINTDRWENVIQTVEGNYNEWFPYYAEPQTDDAHFRLGDVQDLDTFNPLAATTVFEWKMLRMVYDKLLRVGPDMELQPSAADDFEVVDGTTIDVELREDMEFHDGEPVTPEDVKFTFDYMVDWGIGYFEGFLNPLDEVELKDDETIRFHLEEENATFLTNTLTQIVILPKHIWGDLVEPEDDHIWGEMMDDPSETEGYAHPDEFENDPAIGSGPYEYDSWSRGSEISIDRNDDYHWAEDGPPFDDASGLDVDEITYIIYGHEEGVMGALESDEIDLVADGYSADYISRVEDMDHVEYSSHVSVGFHYLVYDNSTEPFDDRAFRRSVIKRFCTVIVH